MKKRVAEDIFNKLYDDTYDNALAYVLECTGKFSQAEDILSDTYTSVYRRLLKSGENDIENIRGYFFTCLKNSVKRYYVKKPQDELLYEDIAAATDTDAEAMINSLLQTEINLTERQAASRMLIDRILRYVEGKDELSRRAFIMRFYLGYPLSDISKRLTAPQSTLNNCIYRLLYEIREKFTSEYTGR